MLSLKFECVQCFSPEKGKKLQYTWMTRWLLYYERAKQTNLTLNRSTDRREQTDTFPHLGQRQRQKTEHSCCWQICFNCKNLKIFKPMLWRLVIVDICLWDSLPEQGQRLLESNIAEGSEIWGQSLTLQKSWSSSIWKSIKINHFCRKYENREQYSTISAGTTIWR